MEQFDALAGCMSSRPHVSHTYSISVRCLFSSFICLVFGDTTFLMSGIEFLTLFYVESPIANYQKRNRCRQRTVSVESKFKDIYIGKLIQQKVDEKGISYAEFARKIHCARTSLYHIFNSKNIDVERLLLISEILQYDFINEVYHCKPEPPEQTPPCLVLPFKSQGIDTTNIPPELLELLKQQLL